MPAETKGIVPPFYLPNGADWAAARERAVVTDGQPGVRVLERGIILPAREDTSEPPIAPNGCMEGGVCDETGAFVAGHSRSGAAKDPLNCLRAWRFEASDLRQSSERVVFCGVLFSHFGHLLIDSTTRFWYLTPENVGDARLAFVVAPVFSRRLPPALEELVAAQGLDPRSIEIVTEPTQFAEVIVPDEAFAVRVGGTRAAVAPFHRVRDRLLERQRGRMCDAAPRDDDLRIYLSRGKFNRNDCINESYLEQFFARRGFRVVHPEKLPFADQVATIAQAREVVATVGTLSHLATLFSRDDARLTFFVRGDDVHHQQLVLDRLFDKAPAYIDATCCPLPTTSNVDAHLFGPTGYFADYLRDAGIAFAESELEPRIPSNDSVVEFLLAYLRGFTKGDRRGAEHLRRFDMADVLASLSTALTDTPATRDDFLDCSAIEVARQQQAFKVVPGNEICAASWKDGRLTLELQNPALSEDAGFGVAMVNQATGQRRAVRQTVSVEDSGRARLEVDLEAFFAGLCAREGAEKCERWDLFIEAPGLFAHLKTAFGCGAYTGFANALFCKEGKVLVPHACGGEGYLSLWYLGEPRGDFSEDFYHYRDGRPLVNDLACRMIRAGDFALLPHLSADFRAGKIPCVPRYDRTVVYRRKAYSVGYFAFLQACEHHPVRKRPLPQRITRKLKRIFKKWGPLSS